MLAQVPMYREQLLDAAKERGWDRPSVVPITEVHAFLRSKLAAPGMSEARRNARRQPNGYRPNKKTVALRVVDRVLPGPGGHIVEFKDDFRIQVHGGSGRDDLLYAMKPIDMRYEGRSPGVESRREYQYAALKAVLGDRPAEFIVDRDGNVRAVLTARGASEHRRPRQTMHVRNPTPVDRAAWYITGHDEGDLVRSVSGPYTSKREASDAARKFNRERALRWGAPYQGMDMQDAEKRALG